MRNSRMKVARRESGAWWCDGKTILSVADWLIVLHGITLNQN